MSSRGSHTRLGLRQPPARNHAARAARKQKQEHHHRQCIDGMAQEQDEALDEGDLDQDVSQTDRDEIEQAQRTRLLAPSAPSPAEAPETPARPEARWPAPSPARPRPDSLFQSMPRCSDLGMQYLPELQSEKEKRRVVGHGRHVVRIALRKSFGDRSPGSAG